MKTSFRERPVLKIDEKEMSEMNTYMRTHEEPLTPSPLASLVKKRELLSSLSSTSL